jgi:hypothetical protein
MRNNKLVFRIVTVAAGLISAVIITTLVLALIEANRGDKLSFAAQQSVEWQWDSIYEKCGEIRKLRKSYHEWEAKANEVYPKYATQNRILRSELNRRIREEKSFLEAGISSLKEKYPTEPISAIIIDMRSHIERELVLLNEFD